MKLASILSPTVVVAIAVCALAACSNTGRRTTSSDTVPQRAVLMVCEHGNVKSVIAAQLFDQAARQQGLGYRAISRGVTPEPRVPPAIAAALEADGFNVKGYEAQPVSSADVASASRVVAIGVDLSRFTGDARHPIENWNDIPPASADYAASRAALVRHIDTLLEELRGAAP